MEKLQNLEKCIFCCFAGGPQRYPSLSQTLKKLQNLEKCIFCWFPGRVQRYPTLSVLISDPRKIAKPGKKHFLLFCGRSQNFEKLQNLEKCIFCWFPGRVQRYPTLSVLISDARKIAKPGKMHFLLVRGRAKTWKNCKTWKNAFFAALREGPNAIQRYPSLSQTLEKLQNLEKSIFCCFAGGLKLGKMAKPGKMHFLLLYWRAPTLSNAIRPYPPYPKPLKNCKTWKTHFLLFCGMSQNL